MFSKVIQIWLSFIDKWVIDQIGNRFWLLIRIKIWIKIDKENKLKRRLKKRYHYLGDDTWLPERTEEKSKNTSEEKNDADL